MRVTSILTTILILLCSACSDNTRKFHISGSGVEAGDTLYLFGLDKRYEQMDTIIANDEGKFSHTIAADTLIPLELLAPDGKEIILFAEPDLSATISPDTAKRGNWQVESGIAQQIYDSMATKLEPLGPAYRNDEIEKFVERNPMNEVGIILFRRYLMEIPRLLNRNTREITNKFGGRLQDNDYIVETKRFFSQRSIHTNVMYASLPVFDYTEMDDSTNITNKRYKDKFTILSFWASWDTLSRQYINEISDSCRRFKEEDVTQFNISLDHDTAEWRKAVKADSISGDNICNQDMWDNSLIKRYNVSKLPYSVIINPQLMSVAYNVAPEKLGHTLDSLITRHKKEEEARKKKEKRLRKRR